MAVISVREVFDNRRGVLSGSEDSDVRTFLVVTNSKSDNAKTIEASGLVPARLSSHPTKPRLLVDSLESEQEKGAYRWRTTAKYSLFAAPQLPVQPFQPDPLLRQSTVVGRSINVSEALTHAKTFLYSQFASGSAPLGAGNGTQWFSLPDAYKWAKEGPNMMVDQERKIANSAHDAIEDLTHEVAELVFRATWNVFPMPTWIDDYANAVNAFPVMVKGRLLGKRTLKLKGFAISDLLQEIHNVLGVKYYFTISADFHYRAKTWCRIVADTGRRRRDATTGEMKILLGKDGKPLSQPVPLDGTGEVIDPFLDPFQEKFSVWLKEDEKNFSVFPLDPPLAPPTLSF